MIMGGNSWYRGVGHKGVMLNQSFLFFCFESFCSFAFACRIQKKGRNLV